MSLTAKDIPGLLKKNLLLTTCAVLALVLIIIIYSRSGLLDEQQGLLDQKSSQGKRYHTNLVNAAQLTDELQALVEANRILKEHAIDPSDLARNLQYFYRIESESGIKYTDLRQVGAATNVKRSAAVYIPVAYTISVQGDFTKMINFLRNLEHGEHFFRLNTLVATGKNSDMTLNINADLLGQP